jgi:hypothetical protein
MDVVSLDNYSREAQMQIPSYQEGVSAFFTKSKLW